VRHWLPALNVTFGRQVTAVTADVLRSLMTHSWPGNVRELKNVLEISFLHLPPQATTLASLPEPLDLLSTGVTDGGGGDEREQLLSALVATRWNISETARRLRWSRMTIYRRLAKYELPVTRPVTPKAGVVTASDSQ
jgi:transcriptional regulator of acetoin/glycerol metabolism